MKTIIPHQKDSKFDNSLDYLHNVSLNWISEIEFIEVEQDFLKELLAEHIIGLCDSHNFTKAKLFLNGINHEKKLGKKLIKSIQNHQIDLGLLMEKVNTKKENSIRSNQESLNIEVKNYIDNFKFIKKQVFELILLIMKKDKQQKLLQK